MSFQNFGGAVDDNEIIFNSEVTAEFYKTNKNPKNPKKKVLHYIDQVAPRNKPKLPIPNSNKDVEKLLKCTNTSTIPKCVEKVQKLQEDIELHTQIINVIQDFEDISNTPNEQLCSLIHDAFTKSLDFEEMHSAVSYAKKLLKCSDTNEMIHKIKQLSKRKRSMGREAKTDTKAINKLKAKMSELETVTEKLRTATGLDQQYDSVLVLK